MGGPITIEFLDRFAEAWNHHDADVILSMMTSDCIMFLSGGPDSDGRRLVGPEAVRAATIELFNSLPDAQWNGATHFVAGDRGVTQWTFTATRPDGTKIKSVGCDLFVFRDGLIAVKDSYRKQVAY
jgi:ketosteroid isomerase-like protein